MATSFLLNVSRKKLSCGFDISVMVLIYSSLREMASELVWCYDRIVSIWTGDIPYQHAFIKGNNHETHHSPPPAHQAVNPSHILKQAKLTVDALKELL